MTDRHKDLLCAVAIAAALFVLLSYGMGVLL
jgi:hypothetical protein